MFKILTLPNLFTLLRVVLIPFFIYAALTGRVGVALLLFLIAGLSDGVDGYLARRLQQISRLGQVLDPAADKLLLVTAYLVLSMPSRYYEPLPVWLTVAVFARDLGIVLGALIVKIRTGFSDFKPSVPGKWNTVVLITTVACFLLVHCLQRGFWLLPIIYWIALGMIVFSGFHYIYFVKLELNEYYKRGQR